MSGLRKLMIAAAAVSEVDLDTLTNQVLIWDVADATVSGGKVVTIPDRSGNGNNLIDAGADRCSYNASGANGKPYAVMDAGKLFYVTPTSYTTSPITIYSVVQLPSQFMADASVLNGVGLSGGVNGMHMLNSGLNKAWRVYIGGAGISYGELQSQLNRTDVLLVKTVYKDDNSIWIEVNDEPIGKIADASAGSSFNFFAYHAFHGLNNLKIYETRVFSEVTDASKDQTIKNSLISKYAIGRPSGLKNVIVFGDSHTAGIQSGVGNVLGGYRLRLINDGGYNIVSEGYSGTVIDPGTSGQGGSVNFSDRYVYGNRSKWNDFNVIINYGTNDAAIRGSVGAPTSTELRTSLGAKIQTFIDAGFPLNKIIVVTPPYNSGSYTNPSPGVLADVVNDIKAVITLKGVTLCDWYQACIDAGQDVNTIPSGDGIHCNDAMHTTLINTLTPLIQS